MHSKYLLFAIIVLAFMVLASARVVLAADDPPMAPIKRPLVAASAYGSDQAPAPPSNSTTPGVLDPTDIYNNLLIPDIPDTPNKPGKRGNLPPQSQAAKDATMGTTWAGVFVTSTVPIGLTPLHPCVDFNDKSKWASQIVANGVRQGTAWKDHYAGWGFFAVDDPRYYRSQPVAFSLDENVGNQISAKITSNQPYAAGYGSPLIPVRPGDEIRVIARYLLANQPPKQAYDWASLGVKPDAVADNAVYANGYVRGMWAELEQATIAQGDHIMVLLQAQSPAAINSNIWFDDVEISVNGNTLPDCELLESFSKN